MLSHASTSFFFFFNDTATTEIYTLSLHDALPISLARQPLDGGGRPVPVSTDHSDLATRRHLPVHCAGDRKSTRLNSSHLVISYAVFCLKKKKYTTLYSRCYSYYNTSRTTT